MEIRNETTSLIMHPGLLERLEIIRKQRGFNAREWIDAKAILLNDYMRHFGLKACVIAISGGIDSAVVLGIAVHAKSLPNSPIEKIVPLTIPATHTRGVTGQAKSSYFATDVCESFNLEHGIIDLQGFVEDIVEDFELSSGLNSFPDGALRGNDWAVGQLVSYLRTPIIYYMTSLLAQNKMPTIVLGTTNLSEGGYIGFFGKSSDGMVDVQLISDLYKSEVYKVAKLLRVPQEIIDRTPTGDMFDASPDEVVFGAPYDFVELFMENKRGNLIKTSFEDRERYMPPDQSAQYQEYAENLERMHKYNAHKYLGKSPAVHLDIMPCAMPGGWNNEPPVLPDAGITTNQFNIITDYNTRRGREYSELEDIKCFNGPTVLGHVYEISKAPVPDPDINVFDSQGSFTIQLLDEKTAPMLAHDIGGIHWSHWRAAGLDGYKIPDMEQVHQGIWGSRNLTPEQKASKGDYYKNLPENYEDIKIGSWRATTVNKQLSDLIWERIQPHLDLEYMLFNPEFPVLDNSGHCVWKPVGISEVMRFIMYRGIDTDSQLLPHYDAPFVYNNRKRTLKSLVVYINSPWEGGETRFIKDPQEHVPLKDRDLNDWTRPPTQDEIKTSIKGKNGMGICFNHRLLHDGAPLVPNSQSSKIILRTDVIYSRLDWYR